MTSLISTSKTLIVNDNNELLLLKIGVHTVHPERSYTYDLPGGIVDNGESERDGAVREIKEETGIDISPSSLQLVYSETIFEKEKKVIVNHLRYFVHLDHTPEVKVSWEHEMYEWVDINSALQQYNLRPHFQKAIEIVQQTKMFALQ